MTTKSKSHFMIFFGNPIQFQPYTLYLGKILTITRHHGFHIGITSHGLYKWAKILLADLTVLNNMLT